MTQAGRLNYSPDPFLPLRTLRRCREDECERVRKFGARIMTLDQIEGLKVWPCSSKGLLSCQPIIQA